MVDERGVKMGSVIKKSRALCEEFELVGIELRLLGVGEAFEEDHVEVRKRSEFWMGKRRELN